MHNSYGVEEYYLYDPDSDRLNGWCRSEDGLLNSIEAMSGWVSPRLGIRFELDGELQLYHPDGVPFFTFAQINQRLEQERQRAEQAEQRAAEMAALLQQYRDRFGDLT